MSSERGGVRLSVEALERRDVPSRLSTALDNIVSQQFTGTGTPAHGAFNYGYGIAGYDGDVPTYLTDTYFGAYACLALIQQKYDAAGEDADADDRVGWWIDWNLRNVAGDGTFLRRFYRADGSVPGSNPTGPTDAHDSDASLLLMVANAYAQAGYDTSRLTAAGVRAKFEAVAGKLLSLQQPDGLTWGKDTVAGRFKYLMDNCESYAGFLAAAQLESAVWNDPAQAAVYRAAAAQVKQGILATLYDPGTGLFRPDDTRNVNLQQFYPAYGITFPAAFGVLDLNRPDDLATARRQVQALDDYWNGVDRRNWRTQIIRGVEDMGLPPGSGNFFATPLAYSPLLSGNTADSTTFTTTVYDNYYPSGAVTPQYGDLTVADNAWLALALGAIDGNPSVTTLTVNGTSAADAFVLNRTPGRGTGSITLGYNGGLRQAYTGVGNVLVNGRAGNDHMTVFPAVGSALVTQGVGYIGGTETGEANTLIVQAQGQPVSVTPTNVTIWDFFNLYHANTAKVTVNAAFTVNSLVGPDTAGRDAIPGGLSANDKWVRRLYLDVLGRAASATDLTHWLNRLATGGTREGVAAAIAGSFEARSLTVRKWYSLYLGRPVSGGEESGWVGLLVAGYTEEDVLAAILGSPEYYARTSGLFTGGTADDRFVRGLYLFLLQRTPSGGEVSGWAGVLSASSPTAVARAFLASAEYRTSQVSGAFVTYLQRPADSVALGTYPPGPDTLARLRSVVVTSAEYYQL